eukprot:gnl/MRDRNA2_/MRDRNA2_104991_c0_seq1.p1 gnl/MRDRNA2_/MRDRNA2_104991_c0~~gnl/MRDRNA2_/MRDRNA2_104991_c0_seq1.p1  ORF type:complete len:225 (-),score=41.89 gnl/MRDRNA2_/MRDRNA2_104991_c0_seq1:32-706(-)
MLWLRAIMAFSYSSLVSVGAARVRLLQPAGEADVAYQDQINAYIPAPENPDPMAMLAPAIDEHLLNMPLKMDNEKCRILCQSPYACREVKRPWWSKRSEICQRWGMNKLGEAFSEELFAVHLDLGACMRKCDHVFPLEEGIPVAPAPRARNTPAPKPVVQQPAQQEEEEGEPGALPTLSPEELKEQDEEYLRETAPKPPPPPKPQGPTMKEKYPNLFKYDQDYE